MARLHIRHLGLKQTLATGPALVGLRPARERPPGDYQVADAVGQCEARWLPRQERLDQWLDRLLSARKSPCNPSDPLGSHATRSRVRGIGFLALPPPSASQQYTHAKNAGREREP